MTPRPPKVNTDRELHSLENMIKKMPTLGTEYKKTSIKPLIHEFNEVIAIFKELISYFNKQMRELRWDWQRALKNIIVKKVHLENEVISDMKKKLDEKQKELDRVAKETSFLEKHYNS